MTKLEVTEKTEVIEEINVEDGADPGYQLDPGVPSCVVRITKLSAAWPVALPLLCPTPSVHARNKAMQSVQ